MKNYNRTFIQEKLFSLQDEEYANFQSKLTPNIERDKFIGVRVPKVRELAKEIYKEGNYLQFLNELPHKYYDENMLHGLIISEIKDYNTCVFEVETFLPFVDNWAVCDIMSPKVFKKNNDNLIEKIIEWTKSKHTYTCRFAIEMLMSHFLDKGFNKEYLFIPAKIASKEYYVKMMVAWFFATALSKQWEETIKIIESKILEPWTHNKTIQKALESNRISLDNKNYLKTLRIK